MSETRMDVADARVSRRAANKRRIRIPGKAERYDNTDPVTIAREMRAKSKLGALERKLG